MGCLAPAAVRARGGRMQATVSWRACAVLIARMRAAAAQPLKSDEVLENMLDHWRRNAETIMAKWLIGHGGRWK